MISNTIIGAPNILFLGAGASRPYGKLLMGEFVRSFRQKTAQIPATVPAPKSLLEAICDKREDLEFLIGELDALGSRGYLEQQIVSSSNPNLPSQGWRWPDFQQLAIEARRLLAALKREVYLHYRDIPDPALTDVLIKPISLLKVSSHPTVVFTTNYDPAVEEFCAREGLRITDGFVRDTRTRRDVWDRRDFDGFELSEEESLVLFKLHGSADWLSNNGRIVRSQPIYNPTDPDYQNVMIYPATSKVAIEEPFFTAYDYLEQCLDRAESCLAIGYSFRDYDTLMRFKSAMLSNKRLRVAVLDPNADSVCKHLNAHGIEARPIPYVLGGYQESEYLPLITNAVQG
jgi:hypothetical protein